MRITIPAVSTLAPALNNVSTSSTSPFLHAHTNADVPYYNINKNKIYISKIILYIIVYTYLITNINFCTTCY